MAKPFLFSPLPFLFEELSPAGRALSNYDTLVILSYNAVNNPGACVTCHSVIITWKLVMALSWLISFPASCLGRCHERPRCVPREARVSCTRSLLLHTPLVNNRAGQVHTACCPRSRFEVTGIIF